MHHEGGNGRGILGSNYKPNPFLLAQELNRRVVVLPRETAQPVNTVNGESGNAVKLD